MKERKNEWDKETAKETREDKRDETEEEIGMETAERERTGIRNQETKTREGTEMCKKTKDLARR